jgi:hypothetical protein
MAKKLNKNKIAAARIRARYLQDQLEVYIQDGSDLALHWAWENIAELIYLFDKCQFEEKICTNGHTKITDEMKETALQYPINTLVQNTKGKATAWCHNDKNPSLHINLIKNKAFCNVCNKVFNPIDVLIERDGMKWSEAVKHLN